MSKPTVTKTVPTTIEEALDMLEAEKAARATAETDRDRYKTDAELYLTRLNGAKKDEIAQVLDDCCGVRFEPAEREEFERLANESYKNNPTGLRSLLERMPELTKKEPGAKAVEQDLDSPPAKQITESDKLLAKKMGIEPAELAKMDDLVEVTHDGFAVYKDGTREKIERVN